MNGRYEIGDQVLYNWKLVKLLGAGAFGKVYEAQREEYGVTYKAAIKIITIPQSISEVHSVKSEGYTDAEVTKYFEDIVKNLVNECAFMSQVKGVTNIVGYEDHVVIPHKGQLGWDIIIRMELLTPLLEHVTSHSLKPMDVAKLGVDICKALEVCQRMNIIHRDVKPENIMLSPMGDYKLGDFGISRTVEKTQEGLSKKGTKGYMAPEVAKGEAYGATVDIYSLGIVMYRFLNDNRAPFLPPPPATISFSEREQSHERRLRGEALPAPRHADAELSRIVLKACAYSATDRYQKAQEFREDIEAWMKYANNVYNSFVASAAETETGKNEKYVIDTESTMMAFHMGPRESKPSEESTNDASVSKLRRDDAKEETPEIMPVEDTEVATPGKKKKKSKLPVIIAASIAAVALIGGGIFAISRLGKQNTNNVSESQGNGSAIQNIEQASEEAKQTSEEAKHTSTETHQTTEEAQQASTEEEKVDIYWLHDFSRTMSETEILNLAERIDKLHTLFNCHIVMEIVDENWKGEAYTEVWTENMKASKEKLLKQSYVDGFPENFDVVYILVNLRSGQQGYDCDLNGSALDMISKLEANELEVVGHANGNKANDLRNHYEDYILTSLENAMRHNSVDSYVKISSDGYLCLDDSILGQTKAQLTKLWGTAVQTSEFPYWTSDGILQAYWPGTGLGLFFLNDVLVGVTADGNGKISDYDAYCDVMSRYEMKCIKKDDFQKKMKQGRPYSVSKTHNGQNLRFMFQRWDQSKLNTDGYMQYGIFEDEVSWYFE